MPLMLVILVAREARADWSMRLGGTCSLEAVSPRLVVR
jgi:hypothetical protein